jgi:hypothetical protein
VNALTKNLLKIKISEEKRLYQYHLVNIPKYEDFKYDDGRSFIRLPFEIFEYSSKYEYLKYYINIDPISSNKLLYMLKN